MKICTQKKEVAITRRKVFCGIIILVIFLFGTGIAGFSFGKSMAIDQAAAKLTADRMEEKTQLLHEKQGEVNMAKNELFQIKKDLDDKKADRDALNDFVSNRDKLNTDLADKASKAEQLGKDIESKNAELERLTGDVLKAKGAPKRLGAGEFVVGQDLESGRYLVTGSSNFIVYSASGSLKVNTILGGGTIGQENYTCTLNAGDKMTLHSACQFTPVGY